MARIARITTQKDTKGNPSTITINLKKHKKAIPVLQSLGLIEKTQFQIDCESGISVEEFRQHLHTVVKNLPWK